MKTTIETVATCQIGEIRAFAASTGAGITIVKGNEKDKDAYSSSFYLSLEQADSVVRCLQAALTAYRQQPKTEKEEP